MLRQGIGDAWGAPVGGRGVTGARRVASTSRRLRATIAARPDRYILATSVADMEAETSTASTTTPCSRGTVSARAGWARPTTRPVRPNSDNTTGRWRRRDDPAVDGERAGQDVAAERGGEAAADLGLDGVGERLVRRHEQGGGVRPVLGLRDEVRGVSSPT